MPDNLVDLARNVEKARADLDRAIERLRAATGLSSSTGPRRTVAAKGVPAPSGASGSVSQAVLTAIQARPDGVQRAGLLHLGNVGAVHSALKVHKGKGLIFNKDGRWFSRSAVAKGAGATAAKKKGPEAP